MSVGAGTSYEDLTAYSLLFQVISDAAGRQTVLQLAQPLSVPAGTRIIRQGDRGEELYLVREGRVQVSTMSAGRQIVLGVLESGTVFGEVAQVGGVERTADVIALTDVALLRFNGPRLLALVKRYPNAEKVLERIVAHRAEDTIEKTLTPGAGQ